MNQPKRRCVFQKPRRAAVVGEVYHIIYTSDYLDQIARDIACREHEDEVLPSWGQYCRTPQTMRTAGRCIYFMDACTKSFDCKSHLLSRRA
jgi:hypothetical protein